MSTYLHSHGAVAFKCTNVCTLILQMVHVQIQSCVSRLSGLGMFPRKCFAPPSQILLFATPSIMDRKGWERNNACGS
jgi:hypothetical protein